LTHLFNTCSALCISEHTVERSLGISAFLYEMPEGVEASPADYVALLIITDSIFRDIFDWFFENVSDVIYGSSQVSDCKALTPFLVQCDVKLHFSDEGYLPTQEQLEEIAVQELQQGKSFHQQYLDRLRSSENQVFSVATDARYIHTEDDLAEALAVEQAKFSSQHSKEDKSSSPVKIVVPIVAVFILFLLGLSVHYRYVQQTKGRRIMAKDENIMKHKDRDDVEDGTIAGDTYKTSAFSEDGAISAYEDFQARARKNKKTKENLDKEMDRMIRDLEEVSLASSTSRMSGKNSADSDDGSESSIVVATQAKTVTVVLDDSCKPAWAQRASQAAAAATAAKPIVPKSDLSPRFQVPASSEFVPSNKSPQSSVASSVATPKNDTPSPEPTNEVTSKFSSSTKEALSMPILEDEDNSESDLLFDNSSALVLPSSQMLVTTDHSSTLGVTEPTVAPTSEETAIVPSKIKSSWLPAPMISSPSTAATETTTAAAVPTEGGDAKPDWSKARLRPVPKSAQAEDKTQSPPPSSSSQPEWMTKFKQMGLDKSP